MNTPVTNPVTTISSVKPQNMKNPKATFLKRSLYADTIFTAVSGLGLLTFSSAMTTFLGWSISWIVPVLGVIFLLYAMYLYSAARANTPNSFMVKTIIGVAIVWLIESYIVILLPASNPLALSTSGKWAVAIFADIGFIFGLTQFLGLRRLKR